MKKNKTLKVIASSTMISSLVLSAIATPIMAKEGWNEINGSWTYESNGSKQTGWSKIGNSWFSFDKNGTMQTGWTASGEFWYWLSPGSGVMQDNGWITDGSNQPFFIEPNGVMATDTVKDGYEIKADGTRVLLSDSNSVVLGAEGLPEGTVVEGNLYVTADAAKDLELKGITVKGKLVIEGGQNVKLTDSNIQGLKMNQADAVVTLSGKTEVKNAELTKQGTLEGDKNYKGEVENVKIASLVKGEATIGVETDTVTSNSWAPVNVEANVKNLIVSNETELNIGKGIVVDKVVADAPVVIKGEGKITELEANSDGVKADVPVNKVTGDNKGDVTNTEGGVVEKPSTGGGSSGGNGGGSVTPPTPDKTIAPVGSEAQFIEAMGKEEVKTIKFTQNFTTTKTLVVNRQVIIDGDGKTLTCTDAVNNKGIEGNALLIKIANGVTVKNLNVVMDAAGNTDTNGKDKWDSVYGIQVYNSTGVTLDNVSSKLGDGGILVNSSTVTLTGNINVSGNQFGGIEVSQGEGLTVESELKLGDSSLILENDTESITKPTIWVINNEGTITGKALPMTEVEDKTYYSIYDSTEGRVSNVDELKNALLYTTYDTVKLINDIENISESIFIRRDVVLEGNDKKITFTDAINTVEVPNDESKYRSGLIVEETTATVNNLTVEMADETVANWEGIYAIQISASKNLVTLNNVSATNADGGIFVNGSNVKMTGKIDVSGNRYGGIELGKGAVAKNEPILDITEVEEKLNNSSEKFGEPTIWTDGITVTTGKTIIGAEALFATEDVKVGQTHYYLDEENKTSVEIKYLENEIKPNTPSSFKIYGKTGGINRNVSWKGILLKNGIPFQNEDFTTDENGIAYFGSKKGFNPKENGLEDGIEIEFCVTLAPGEYTLEVSLVEPPLANTEDIVIGDSITIIVTVPIVPEPVEGETEEPSLVEESSVEEQQPVI